MNHINHITGLDILFNVEKKNLKSREDCVVLALHQLLLNENLVCAGIGETWLENNFPTSELLPKNWNDNEGIYNLRYVTQDKKSRLLLKIIKMEDTLQVNVIENEDHVLYTSFPVDNFVRNDYREYSSTYENLDSLRCVFNIDITQRLQNAPKMATSSEKCKHFCIQTPETQPAQSKSLGNLQPAHNQFRFKFPEVGKSDLDPTGQTTGGGMFLDPASIGIPPRPTIPKGIPKGSVPPGARFDPFLPPDPCNYKKPPTSDDSDDSD